MKYLSIAVLFIIFGLSTQAEPVNYGSATASEVTSIYDGDTFKATIHGWHALICERISIRVNGVDTPEMRGKCDQEKQLARKAKQHACCHATSR